MAWYPFGNLDNETGPMGPPGNGFKLTDDGNYDMENKILKNCIDPVDDQDVTTRAYVLHHIEESRLKLKNQIIKDSFEKYVDETSKKIKDLETKSLNHDGTKFDAQSKKIINAANPQDKMDVANKNYVDKKIKINDKKPDNILIRDHDGLYVPSFMKNGLFNFENKRLINLADPIIETDAATKKYVDNSRNFYATIQEKSYNYEAADGFKKINFSKFSNDLLDHDMKLTMNMDMKVTLYLTGSSFEVNPLLQFSIGTVRIRNSIINVKPNSVASETFFTSGRKGLVFSVEILAEGYPGQFNNLKPYLLIEQINFL